MAPRPCMLAVLLLVTMSSISTQRPDPGAARSTGAGTILSRGWCPHRFAHYSVSISFAGRRSAPVTRCTSVIES